MRGRTGVPRYGMGKIQRLPSSLWPVLRLITRENDLRCLLLDEWNTVGKLVGSTESARILQSKRLSPSSFYHTYGILSSAILRAGGSGTTRWFGYDVRPTLEPDIEAVVVSGREEGTLYLPHCETRFAMAPFYVALGTTLFDAMEGHAISITRLLCRLLPLARMCAARHTDHSSALDDLLEHYQEYTSDLPGLVAPPAPLPKICTKVDFTFETVQGRIVPVVVDINDLHGGLQWIDDFERYYAELDTSYGSLRDKHRLGGIVARFVHGYLAAYRETRGHCPKTVVICLDDKERWDADSGRNYEAMADEFATQTEALGFRATVGLTYAVEYARSLEVLRSTGVRRLRLIDEDGLLTDMFLNDFDLVVRIYRGVPATGFDETLAFTSSLLDERTSRRFLILEDERLRLLFNKAVTQLILEDGVARHDLADSLIIPRRVGFYRLSAGAKITCDAILADARTKGIADIVVKLSDKSRHMATTAFFLNVENERHQAILERTVGQIICIAPDVRHLVVEALVGGPVLGGRKIEIRTLVLRDDPT